MKEKNNTVNLDELKDLREQAMVRGVASPAWIKAAMAFMDAFPKFYEMAKEMNAELEKMQLAQAALATPPAAPVLSAGPITPAMANWSEADKAKLVSVIAQPAPDPCPGCKKGHVCKTPNCGRLKLSLDHPSRTVFHPDHGN